VEWSHADPRHFVFHQFLLFSPRVFPFIIPTGYCISTVGGVSGVCVFQAPTPPLSTHPLDVFLSVTPLSISPLFSICPCSGNRFMYDHTPTAFNYDQIIFPTLWTFVVYPFFFPLMISFPSFFYTHVIT